MYQAPCDAVRNYQDWLNRPAIYDSCQPSYSESQTISQEEVDEWIIQAAPSSIEDETRPVETRSLEERFHEQAEKWHNETRHLSSPNQRMLHPSYQAILGMGQEHRDEIIDLLLKDMKENRRQWFWALSYLAQTNPITPNDAGRLDKMIDAWVRWGQTRKIA